MKTYEEIDKDSESAIKFLLKRFNDCSLEFALEYIVFEALNRSSDCPEAYYSILKKWSN